MHGDEGGVASNGQGPRPVPDLGIPESFGQVPAARSVPPVPLPGVSTPPDIAPVTDEDRQTYGRLLDRAFERGLIGSYDYEVRLRELSEATSIDAMKTIVTELPVFAVPTPRASRKPASLGRASAGGSVGGRRSPWTKLVIMVVAVVVAFVVLALYAEHVVHGRTNGNSGAPAAAMSTAATTALPVRFPRP